MKKLLIIQHENDTPPGTTLEWARLRNIETTLWQPALQGKAPAVDAETGIVVCGGGMDTYEEDKYPWLKTEKNFLRERIQKKTKIFGLCLGSQLLAEVLGGKVFPHHGWEVGFLPVKDAQGDSLLVFQFHHVTFDLPPTAERLFSGDYCLNQAFKVGEQIVATQFHPESTKEWIATCSDEVQPHHQGNVQTKEQILASLPLQENLQAWYFKQLDQLFLKK